MRRLLFMAFFLFAPETAFSSGAITCGGPLASVQCVATSNFSDSEATSTASGVCVQRFGQPCKPIWRFIDSCDSVAVSVSNIYVQNAGNAIEAAHESEEVCTRYSAGHPCKVVLTVCDGNNDPNPVQNRITFSTTPASVLDYQAPLNFLDIKAIRTGLSFGIGIVLALLIYAKRASIHNYVIHGNLPYNLPVYGEDIQCLFKRTQRINWYGRVIFGLVANFSTTHSQLTDVRKYWLGRVVAFDSLRRQRQNELVGMHLQLAAKAKSDPHDKKKFWSRRWATLRSFVRKLFWVIIAFVNFILSFFFIRVTIAKLVRGTIVESKDLTLILQAKEAIEESAIYLKEYLDTANTFDGRDEVV
jgi:hypothetical protein